MPTGTRIRANNQFGTITDNPLGAGATTINSAEFNIFPEISGDHAVITLDPMRVNGDPEIVIITAHAAAATVVTVTRGAYGTTPRIHPQATDWVHAPVTEDVTDIVTSSTHPSDPYEGQPIYEEDTTFTKYYDGADFNPISNIFQQDTEPPAVEDYLWVDTDESAGVGLSSIIGYAEKTTSQAGIGAETDITGLSVNVTVPAGRRIRITGSVSFLPTVANQNNRLRIKEGGTVFQTIDSIQASTGQEERVEGSVVISPTAGSHTYKLSGQVTSGTTTVVAGATIPAFILVEDITGSLWPAGASIGAGMIANEAWIPFTAVPVPSSGSFTAATGFGDYIRQGLTIHYRYRGTITTLGTGSGDLKFTPAIPANTDVIVFGSGREAITGASLITYRDTTFIAITGSTLASGKIYDVCGTYEAAS